MPLVIATVLAGLIGGYLVAHQAPTYLARTSIYISAPAPTGSDTSGTDVLSLDRLIATYNAMVTSPSVAQGAVQMSHANRSVSQVLGETSASVVPNTDLINVTVKDRDAGTAQALANGLAATFIAQVQSLGTGSASSGSPAPTVSVFQQAGLPGAPLATSVKRAVALGGLFGLIVSVSAVFLADYLDISVKSVDELEQQLDLPVLGAIPLGDPQAAPLAGTP